MTRKKSRHYVVTVKVISRLGTKPIARVLGYDTVFVALTEGQTATFTTKRTK